jgi:hypothetical protein
MSMIVIFMIVIVMPASFMMMIVRVAVIMVLMAVMMAVAVLTRLRRIGTAFRLERRFDLDEPGAEAREQCLDRRIALESELAFQHLHRHMTVAEMPSEPGKPWKVGSASLDQELGFRHHVHQVPLLQHQCVIGSKPHRLGEIEFHASALQPKYKSFLGVALGVRQNQRVDDGPLAPLGS